MNRQFRYPSLPLGAAIRIIVDAATIVLIVVGLFLLRRLPPVAGVFDSLLLSSGQEATSSGSPSRQSLSDFAAATAVLVSISINVFVLRGYYQTNRDLHPRKKARAIIQGVVASHVVFGFLMLLLWDVLILPRSVLVASAVLTSLALIALRIYAVRLPVAERLLDRIDGYDTAGKRTDEPKTVLVVGGSGYIGSALLRKLLDNGYRVRVLDALMFSAEPIADMLDNPNLELVEGDFRRVDRVVEAMAGIDTVVHLGAIVGDPACELDHDLTIKTNLVATRMVAEIARAAGVRRMIFASTCSVYGAGDKILNEDSALSPVSLYAKTKIACEEVLRPMASDQFAPVILRFGTTYGLSGRTRFDLVVNLLTAKAIKEGEITIYGGDQWRPFVHVDDVAAAVLAAVAAPTSTVHNKVFNVGSDEQNMTIRQVGEMIGSIVESAEVVELGMDGDRRDYRVDFSRIREELDFHPAWTVEMGIRQVLDAVESGAVQNYQDAKYSNVQSLRNGPNLGPQDVDIRPHSEETAALTYRMDLASVGGSWTQSIVQMMAGEPLDLTGVEEIEKPLAGAETN